MKWGRKKSAASSSTTTASAIITRVLPVSWISKFKQKGGSFETSSEKEKQRGKVDFPTPKSSVHPGWREGRFYSMDEDDAYWRLSFTGGRRSTGGLMNPLWYDSDDEFQVPLSSFKSFGLGELDVSRSEENRNFDDMVLDIKKMKEKIHKEGISIGNDGFRGRKVNGGNDQRSRKQGRRDLREKEEELERGRYEEEKTMLKSVEKDIFKIEKKMVQTKKEFSRKRHNITFPNLGLSSIEKDRAFDCLNAEEKNATSERLPITEWQNLENKKIKEIKIKTESQRKAANLSREFHSRKTKQNNRVKAYSPRTECKIRALEDMKKSRIKLKKKVPKEQLMEDRTMFDSFAVVKSSFNPQWDFRDSMVEMILEKEIKRPEELEELLACYLTLNCDEYHDLIIKVFRQVWFELNGGLPQS